MDMLSTWAMMAACALSLWAVWPRRPKHPDLTPKPVYLKTEVVEYNFYDEDEDDEDDEEES